MSFLSRSLIVLAALSLCFNSCHADQYLHQYHHRFLDRFQWPPGEQRAAITDGEAIAAGAAQEQELKASHGPFQTNQTIVLVYSRDLVSVMTPRTGPIEVVPVVNGADGKPNMDPFALLPNSLTKYSPRHVRTRKSALEQPSQPAGIYFHYASPAVPAWPRDGDFDAATFTPRDLTAALLSELAYEKEYACGASLKPSDDPVLEQARVSDLTAGEFPLQSAEELMERTPSRRWSWKVSQWPLDGWLLHTQLQTSNKDRYNLAVCVYRNPSAKRLLVVVRGTVSWEDWYSNAAWLWQLPPASWSILLLLLQQFYNGPTADLIADHSVSFAGHSLGAGLAELAACTFNTTATTFDSPGTLDMLPLSSVECAHRLQSGEWNRTRNLKSYLSHPGNLVHFGGAQAGFTHLAHQFGAWTNFVAFLFSVGVTWCCAIVCFVSLSAGHPLALNLASSLFLTGPLLFYAPVLFLPVSWLSWLEQVRWPFVLVTVCVSVWHCTRSPVSKLAWGQLSKLGIPVLGMLAAIAWEISELHRIDLFTDALMRFDAGEQTRVSPDLLFGARSKASSIQRWHEYFWLVYLMCFILVDLKPRLWTAVAVVGAALLTFPISVAPMDWLYQYLVPALLGVKLAGIVLPLLHDPLPSPQLQQPIAKISRGQRKKKR